MLEAYQGKKVFFRIIDNPSDIRKVFVNCIMS